MTPRHHLPDDLLMAHASGVASRGVDVLVTAHLVLCPGCRGRVAELEALGGAVLDDAPPAALDSGLLDGIMGRLNEGEPPLTHPPATDDGRADAVLPSGLVLPRPIRELVLETDAAWKTVVPGLLHQLPLPVKVGEMPLRLIRLRSGFVVPNHTHRGIEINLVLSGGYHDEDQEFERGDVQVSDEEVTHSLQIDPGEDCVLLAVNDSPLVPVGFMSKIAKLITGNM